MPEIPEVETIARRLRPELSGRRILHPGGFGVAPALPLASSAVAAARPTR